MNCLLPLNASKRMEQKAGQTKENHRSINVIKRSQRRAGNKSISLVLRCILTVLFIFKIDNTGFNRKCSETLSIYSTRVLVWRNLYDFVCFASLFSCFIFDNESYTIGILNATLIGKFIKQIILSFSDVGGMDLIFLWNKKSFIDWFQSIDVTAWNNG